MPKYAVIFEREIYERATLWVDAADKTEAKTKAAGILTDNDWERDEIGDTDSYVQVMS